MFLVKNPDIAEEVVREIRNFFDNKKAEIEVTIKNANEFVIREVDNTGRILREKIFNAGNKNHQNESQPEKDNILNPGGFYSHREVSLPSSGCTTPTTSKGSEVGGDFDPLRNRMGSGEPSFFSANPAASGYSRANGAGITNLHNRSGRADFNSYDDGDDDLYEPPSQSTILQNIPLEYLEREIVRRRTTDSSSVSSSHHAGFPSGASSSSASTGGPFDDAFRTPLDEEDGNPPSLPPKIPIGDETDYTPSFSRRSSVLSENSISSSVLSHTSTASSWQDVRTAPTSLHGSDDFLEYERRLRDQLDGPKYDPASSAASVSTTTFSREPSLLYSLNNDLSATPSASTQESEPEALTPVVSRTSTLDRESVIFQDGQFTR